MQIKVYNNNVLVHDGSLQQFLDDNQHDEYITEQCKQLTEHNTIELNELSGKWRIEKQ